MRFLILLTILTSFFLSGCSVLDARAREGVGNHAVIKISDGITLVRSEQADLIWRTIKFCDEWQLSGNYPLKVFFDCELSTSDKATYQRVLSAYHPEIMGRFDASILSDFLTKATSPEPCIYIIKKGTKFRRYQHINDCFPLYLPSQTYSEVLPDWTRNLNLTADHLFFANFALNFYRPWLHEAFHANTLPSVFTFQPKAFSDRYINEYLAYALGEFANTTVLSLMFNKAKINNTNVKIDSDPLYERVYKACQIDDRKVPQLNAPKSVATSLTGLVMMYSVIDALQTDASLMPYYFYHEFNALAAPGLGFNELAARIPQCNPSVLVDVFGLQHQLLDYDFSLLRDNKAESDQQLPGLGTLLHQIMQQQVATDDPFIECRKLSYSAPLQKSCVGMKLDYLTLRQYKLVHTPHRADIELPQHAAAYLARFKAWQKDTEIIQRFGKALPSSSTVIYKHEQDGRFRNINGYAADTGAGLNVWPGDTDCELSGEQLVTTLSGQIQALQRCRLEDGLGIVWRKDGQTDQVIGLPTLVAQQAKLVRDEDAMHYKVNVPYVFQDGFVVFQQMDQQVRLNICLDTGSPLSYITRRYRERYQLTPTYLAARLEPETELGELPRRVVLPILGAQRKVRVLPHAGFMQCDLIMGSDFLEEYTAIELGTNTLTLWYAQEPLASSPP